MEGKEKEERRKALEEKHAPKKAAKTASTKSPELLALVRILIKKGVITKDEYSKELSFLKKQ